MCMDPYILPSDAPPYASHYSTTAASTSLISLASSALTGSRAPTSPTPLSAPAPVPSPVAVLVPAPRTEADDAETDVVG